MATAAVLGVGTAVALAWHGAKAAAAAAAVVPVAAAALGVDAYGRHQRRLRQSTVVTSEVSITSGTLDRGGNVLPWE